MSKDIRSFFNIVGSKKKQQTIAPKDEPPLKPKRKAIAITDSDDECKAVGNVETKKKRRIIDSDDEAETSKKSNASKKSHISPSPKKKLKEVDVMSMFGKEPIKRKERSKTISTPSANTSMSEVIMLNEDDTDQNVTKSIDVMEKKSMKQSPKSKEASPVKEKAITKAKIRTPKKEKKSENKSPASKRSLSSEKKHSKQGSPKKPKVEKVKSEHKNHDLNTSTAEDDELRRERKQAAMALYLKMKDRPTVLNHGSKEIPKGKPDCLKGLQFVISGVLESLERDEAADLIKSCGGHVVSGISKKCTHILIGEEAGPAKLAKADELGIKKVTEDELLSMIRKKSGLPDDRSSVKKETEKKQKKDSPGKENHRSNKDSKKDSDVKIEPKKENGEMISNRDSKKAADLKIEPNKENGNMKSSKASINSAVSTPTVVPPNMDDFSFVDKYKPTSMKEIIGQQGASSNSTKLMNWLTKWHLNNDGKKKHGKSNPWAKNDDGSSYKAALLSGPPGVGKTTTAHLVCKELLFDIVEFNASDTRSKRLLKEEVSQLMSNKSLKGYADGSETKVSGRHVLIMDEVDGMAGNEDRGGVAELIALIKESHIPVICMCNDRNHPKIRSLANYCFDLRFPKPSLQQMRSAMMSICFKEGMKMEAGAIDEIITGTGNDVRQTLNHLALYSATKESKVETLNAKKNAQMSEKNVKIGPFEVVRKVFSSEEHKKMSFYDKCDLFFHDYSMGPLFVQENYLRVKPTNSKCILENVAKAADSLSVGDLVEKRIRSNMAWSMLPTQAVFSSVLPGEYMSGVITSQIHFPAFLGKISRSNKRKRMAQEIHDHTRAVTSGSRLSVRLDYAQFLVQAIVTPLKEKGLEGVTDALEVIREYRLLREDIESLLELTTWPKMKSSWEQVDSKVKAALTRAYNKEINPYSYSAQAGVKKKKSSEYSEEFDELNDDDDKPPPSDDEEEDSLENNALIKIKKPSAKAAKEPKAGTSKSATTSKAKPKSKK